MVRARKPATVKMSLAMPVVVFWVTLAVTPIRLPPAALKFMFTV